MKALLFAVTLASLCAFGAAGQGQRRRADVQVVEAKVRRQDGKITVDGRVRNGEKTIRGLVVIFDFVTAEGAVISSERSDIEQPVMEPGQEAAYHGETADMARAVRCVVRATDRGNRELRVAGSGPFQIE